MRRIFLALLSLTIFVGLAMSEEPLETKSKETLFNYEESISGYGSFASNNRIAAQGAHADPRVPSRLAEVYLQKKTHGSGSIEKESIIKSTESTQNQVDPDVIYAYGLVATLENNSMVYGPQTMSIGNGYYAAHPVSFNSLLGDKTQIKNYASKTSMNYEIRYAHALNMDQVSSVEDDYYDNGDAKSLARSRMDLSGNVASGTARLTMLQGGNRKSKIAWSKPSIEVDQVYTGTFNFATRMNLTIPIYKAISKESWLPCCSGGWKDMESSDQNGFGASAKGIFDCTCLRRLA